MRNLIVLFAITLSFNAYSQKNGIPKKVNTIICSGVDYRTIARGLVKQGYELEISDPDLGIIETTHQQEKKVSLMSGSIKIETIEETDGWHFTASQSMNFGAGPKDIIVTNRFGEFKKFEELNDFVMSLGCDDVSYYTQEQNIK